MFLILSDQFKLVQQRADLGLVELAHQQMAQEGRAWHIDPLAIPQRPDRGQQRADVNRAKQAKKDAKQREREEAVAKRKSGGQEEADEQPTTLPDEPARD